MHLCSFPPVPKGFSLLYFLMSANWLMVYQAQLGSLYANQQHLALAHRTSVKLCPQLIIIVNDYLTLPALYHHDFVGI